MPNSPTPSLSLQPHCSTRRRRFRIPDSGAHFLDGPMPTLSPGLVFTLISMSKSPGRPIWVDDDLVDDNAIQALNVLEFVELLQDAILGDAGPDNPFAPYVAFVDPNGGAA